MNTELTAKQIARIERIRAERKEKLRKMNACSWCCNKTPEDQLIATIDGKYMCVPCIDDYNEDHTDTSYDECDGCGKGYLCQYGQGLQPFADQFCPSCEPDVDARDSPNVAPYKKCAFCHERSSCGNYTDDDQWQCESCAPDEEPMKISNLSSRNLDTLQEGLIIIHAMKINEDYLECIKAIMGLMELFEGDAGFYKLLVDLRDETKNLWRKKLDKNKKRK